MLGSLVLIGALALVQTTDDAALKTEVRKTVRQLDADSKQARDDAETALEAMGPRVLPLLPEGEDLSAEARQRIARVRQKLQQAVNDAGAAGSKVTLQGRLPLSKIFEAIGRQTGNRIVDQRKDVAAAAADPEIAVDFQKTPFWSALDTLLDKAELTVYPFGARDAVGIVARPQGQLPRATQAALTGPFRIEPVQVIARRQLRSATASSLTLMLEVAWEPRVRPIGLTQRLGEVHAVDEHGQAVGVEDPAIVIEAFPRRDGIAVELGVPLLYPPQRPKEIAALKGKLQAIVPGTMETFRFDNLLEAKKVQKRFGAATVTLEQVRRNDNMWEVYIRLRYDEAGDAFESHRNWAQQNEAYLAGADGKPILPDSLEATHRSKNEIGFGYVFALEKAPEGLVFVYKAPGSIVAREFPYELRGIPLP